MRFFKETITNQLMGLRSWSLLCSSFLPFFPCSLLSVHASQRDFLNYVIKITSKILIVIKRSVTRICGKLQLNYYLDVYLNAIL